MAQIVVELQGGQSVVAAITVDSVNRLGLEAGDEARVIIKASSVMIGK